MAVSETAGAEPAVEPGFPGVGATALTPVKSEVGEGGVEGRR